MVRDTSMQAQVVHAGDDDSAMDCGRLASSLVTEATDGENLSQAPSTLRARPALPAATPPAGAQTLLRGLAVLDAVGNGIRSLKALGERLGTTRSTTHRLVSTLVVERYLRVSGGQYFLGPRVLELGFQAREQIPLAALARPYLDKLAALTGDTIHLAVRDGEDVLYIEKIAGRQGLQMRSRVGQRMPIALTGVGKALILDDSPQQWEALFRGAAIRDDAHARERGRDDDADTAATVAALASHRTGVAHARGRFEPDDALARIASAWHPRADVVLPAHTRPSVEDLLARMQTYAAGGYAFDLEDNEPSIRCVAAPVRDASHAIVAAISVSSTTPYMPHERMAALQGVVIDVAHALSAELGCPTGR